MIIKRALLYKSLTGIMDAKGRNCPGWKLSGTKIVREVCCGKGVFIQSSLQGECPVFMSFYALAFRLR